MTRMVLLAGIAVWPLAAVDYVSEIRPVLEKRCYGCHGSRLQKHGLRLDTKAGALRGGDSGVPAYVPGKPESSLMYRYIAGLDKDTKMPPGGPALAAAEQELIGRWIREGAPWPEEVVASEDPKMARGRRHWAFQPRQAVTPPAVRDTAWVRNPIDQFVLARLEAKGWKPASQAADRQLLRRLYFDLTGLPPSMREQEEFDRSPDLDALIDKLLDSPAYAERWGRHWLDVARYAESNGYERDGHKPQAWKYRDYVIRSFAQDKPFDRFLIEQIAGDELDGVTAETLIATGFHRLGPWDDEPADPATDRYDQLDDILSTTSQAFLGLTIGCARCHNHKFEPLTARDYYSLVAVFQGLERPRKGRTELDRPVGTRGELAREAAREAKMQPLREEIAKLQEPYRTKEKGWEEKIPADVKARIEAVEGSMEALRRQTPDLPRGYFLEEPKPDPGPSYVLVRGKPGVHGPEVPPAVPAILVREQPPFPAAAGSTSGRRLSLARWLAAPENPLTARVIVNRVWMWHFGEGLVRTPSDFGLMGQRPTHPELLDWLANEFVAGGWSLKKLHKRILMSSTWRMSKRGNPVYQAEDPENRLLWRMPYKRLEVEAIRDGMLAVSGRLNRRMYGPSMFPPVPAQALEGSSDPDKIWKASGEEEASRRTVYTFLKRSLIVPMLDVLDLCDTARTAAQRMTTSVPTQALTLFNGDFVNQQARYLAARLLEEAGPRPEEQIDLAYRLALARRPAGAERDALLSYLQSGNREANAQMEALEQVARVIFNLNEFAYVD